MAIIRKPMRSKQFTQVPLHWTRDPRLSPAGLGLLTYICSHTASYNLTVKQMLAEHPRGITAIRSAIKELEKLGYLLRHQQRSEKGKFGAYDYEIIEFPQVATGDRFSADGKTDDGSTADGESTPKNINEENTKVKNTIESGPVLSCAASASGVADEDGVDPLFDASPEPLDDDDRQDWRAEDRATFRELLGDMPCNDGSGVWNAVSADADQWYQGFRRHPKRQWKWPGRVLAKIAADGASGGLDDWLLNEGFVQ